MSFIDPSKIVKSGSKLNRKDRINHARIKSKAQQYGGEFILLNKKDEAVTIDYLVAKPLSQK